MKGKKLVKTSRHLRNKFKYHCNFLLRNILAFFACGFSKKPQRYTWSAAVCYMHFREIC